MQPSKNEKPTEPASGEKRQVIIELRPTRALAAAAARGRGPSYGRGAPFDVAALFPDIDIDSSFLPTRVPAERDTRTGDADLPQTEAPQPALRPASERVSNFIIRAEVDDKQLAALRNRPEVAGVFSDPDLVPHITCIGNFARGTDADVARLLCVPKLKSHGLDGSDVLVAIVDTGVNLEYLNAHGKGPNFDRVRSWASLGAVFLPGDFPTDHGTMTSFDLCIAAPRCTLLDIAVIRSPLNGLTGKLSDAIQAYEHLFGIMTAPLRLGELRTLVVSNSWGIPNTHRDLPVGDPGNYSDNINHPFSRSVAALAAAGADILFSAGNCGNDCPSDDCRSDSVPSVLESGPRTIWGANSHPDVLCVAGVDINKARVGYSSQGPGRLTNQKPDICGYTHFKGSSVYSPTPDNGTSTACPVVAGVVAAFRTRWQYDPGDPDTYPVAVRRYLTRTAGHGMSLGYDYDRGHGVVRGCQLVDRFFGDEVTTAPFLSPSFLDEFCRLYPEQCPRAKGGSSEQAVPSELKEMLELVLGGDAGEVARADLEPILAAYLVGRMRGSGAGAISSSHGGCGCHKSEKEG
jgi:subtilisin family serine protease